MRRRGTIPSYVIACGIAPEPGIADRLGTLATAGRQAFSVVVAGDHKAARWRLRVDDQGTLSIPQLGLSVAANRISPSQVGAVAELFAASREPDRPDDGDRVAIAPPVHRHDDAVWTTASRRVAVLGRVTVQGAGDLPAERADLATELVTFLALHPEGVHPHVLSGSLWPRGASGDVRDATIERARRWLGSDVDGSHFLRADEGGRLSLADGVVCDWDCARTLLLDARRARSPREEIELLRRALKMVRGQAFEGVPEGRYGWVFRDDVVRTMVRVVVDGAHRLTQLLNDDDEPHGAAQAAESGLRINPGSQLLWRELMRARYAVSGVAGVRQTLDGMGEALRGIPLEPETEALVEEYLPDSSMESGS